MLILLMFLIGIIIIAYLVNKYSTENAYFLVNFIIPCVLWLIFNVLIAVGLYEITFKVNDSITSCKEWHREEANIIYTTEEGELRSLPINAVTVYVNSKNCYFTEGQIQNGSFWLSLYSRVTGTNQYVFYGPHVGE